MSESLVGVLAWPGAVVILGFAVLLLFRAELRLFLGRTQSIGKGWLVAAAPAQQFLSGVQSEAALELLDLQSGELVREQEKAIRDDLSSRDLHAPSDIERVLVRSLASAQVNLHFEQVHAVIWDGQIQLLEVLNTSPAGTPIEPIKAVYSEEFRDKRPFYREIEFDRYIEWLIDKNLIRIDGELLALTVKGRAFLKWMIDNGKTKRGVG